MRVLVGVGVKVGEAVDVDVGEGVVVRVGVAVEVLVNVRVASRVDVGASAALGEAVRSIEADVQSIADAAAERLRRVVTSQFGSGD